MEGGEVKRKIEKEIREIIREIERNIEASLYDNISVFWATNITLEAGCSLDSYREEKSFDIKDMEEGETVEAKYRGNIVRLWWKESFTLLRKFETKNFIIGVGEYIREEDNSGPDEFVEPEIKKELWVIIRPKDELIQKVKQNYIEKITEIVKQALKQVGEL